MPLCPCACGTGLCVVQLTPSPSIDSALRLGVCIRAMRLVAYYVVMILEVPCQLGNSLPGCRYPITSIYVSTFADELRRHSAVSDFRIRLQQQWTAVTLIERYRVGQFPMDNATENSRLLI